METRGRSRAPGRKGAKAKRVALRLFDPRRGDLAFKVEPLRSGEEFAVPRRVNYFTILWIDEGEGLFDTDLARREFSAPALLFFNPYQTFFLTLKSRVSGAALQFHANFFCIEAHHEAVGCNGVLFNDSFGSPLVRLSRAESRDIAEWIARMENEVRAAGLAHSEILVSYLKVLLIKATRLKLEQNQVTPDGAGAGKPAVLQQLTELIERHYCEKHSPADYARLLSLAPKSLGHLVKRHFGRTLTELIRERLIKHAKWQLLHTQRPVKEVAFEVGFRDEFYFSRLFHRATGFSPTAFREFETAIRGGSNLSM